jgi:hypothetical protein
MNECNVVFEKYKRFFRGLSFRPDTGFLPLFRKEKRKCNFRFSFIFNGLAPSGNERTSLCGLISTLSGWRLISIAIICVLLAGCSNAALYNQMRIYERDQCRKVAPAEYEACLKNTDKTYGEYTREREALLRESENTAEDKSTIDLAMFPLTVVECETACFH